MVTHKYQICIALLYTQWVSIEQQTKKFSTSNLIAYAVKRTLRQNRNDRNTGFHHRVGPISFKRNQERSS